MGRNEQKLEVHAVTSAHNSQRDRDEEALWDDLVARVDAIVDDPKYEPISPLRF